MNKTHMSKLRIAERALFAWFGICICILIAISVCTEKNVTKKRSDTGFDSVENVVFVSMKDDSSPSGKVNTCSFELDEINYAETLVFFVSHHDIRVLIEDESVYEVKISSDSVGTMGGDWVKIPLHESDSGKEVTVILTPVYENYSEKIPEFFVGSELEIYKSILYRAIPMTVLSLCVVFAGLFLVFLAVYNSRKKVKTNRLYALGLMAISSGLWRFTYDKFAYLLFENQTAFIYNFSVICLMVMALSMLNAIAIGGKGEKFKRVFSVVYSVLYIIQLTLQIASVCDLRQMLFLTHMTIVVSAATFIGHSVQSAFKSEKETSDSKNRSYEWILGAGVIADLLMYYFMHTSMLLLFTLVAILCYSMLEGTKLLMRYTEQQNAMEVMGIQLEMSRAQTMMSQIRSHFVFNILNAISGMCKYDPQKADDTVIHFAKYLRNNINIMEDDKNIPFKTDVRQLEEYVALEQVRFGDKIEFYTDIEYDDFFIPPLVLQPVVENAIKHGISKKEGNGTIILRSRDEGDNVVIEVEDSGVGFDMEELNKETSVGIRNIRFRLKHLVNGTMDIKSEVGKGTVVKITIPKAGGKR